MPWLTWALVDVDSGEGSSEDSRRVSPSLRFVLFRAEAPGKDEVCLGGPGDAGWAAWDPASSGWKNSTRWLIIRRQVRRRTASLSE